MKKLLIIMMSFALLMMPLTVYSQSGQKSAGTPPVSQTLVPEGQFALKLATALKLGTPNNEAQAEDLLTSAGIAPKNGWIADYPVTPNIIGELQNAVTTAADAKKLPMGKDEALKVFQSLTTQFGLAVAPGSGQYADSQPPTSSEYVQPQEINNYYYDEGPPVVIYYAPPWDYYYLYDWVPYPFWCAGFFFPGFFVLNDFDIIVGSFHHHHFRITNHFFDSRTHAFGRVDPVNHSWTRDLHTTAFNSTATRNAASSIFNRSMGRTTFARGNQRMTGNHVSSFGRTQGRQGFVTNNRGNAVGGSRSFQSFNRSFSAPSSRGSFSSGHSFSGFSGSHSSSGFSGGHSFGGFSGGHSFGGGGFHGGGGGRR
ncbi:MAG TPA: hypothetical protein VK568_04315 [Thermodesulfobacteriota bacterium]|nr:hypothetical protein [Thermodesulfobacteriota bacterium]